MLLTGAGIPIPRRSFIRVWTHKRRRSARTLYCKFVWKSRSLFRCLRTVANLSRFG